MYNIFMKQILILLTIITSLLLLTSCKPDPYPKHPDYTIKKPKVITTPSKKNLEKMVKQLQGSPYVWAEEGPNNFDCSGFTYYLYGSMGIDIPRVAREQAKVGKRIDITQLQYGDLIFFATNKHNHKKITHVGMYLGNGWFTHASTIKYEVVYSNLYTSSYYKKRLRICRRYLNDNQTTTTKTQKWQITKTLSSTINTKTPDTKISNKQKAIVIKQNIENVEQTVNTGTFYVQVGSFIGKPKHNLLYAVSRQGFKYKIIKFSKADKSISKLLIGPYITHKEANKVLKRVRAEIQKDAFIAEIR